MNKIFKDLSKKHPDEFFIDENIRICYSFDTSFNYSIPSAVFIPKEKNKMIDVVSLLLEKGIPVTPRGKATGRTGGCVPHPESVVVSTERLRNKLQFLQEDEILLCEPGFTIDEINEFLKNYGYFYPPDPASSDIASIGGTVSTNAGGPKAFKYGVTINYVYGIEILIADTSVLKLGGFLKKNKLFYSLKEIFVGAEGTLGLITEIYLRVLKLPECRKNFLIEFEKREEMLDFAWKILEIRNSSLCEMMEHEGKFLLWCEFEGEKETCLKNIEKIRKEIKKIKRANFILLRSKKEEKQILSMRREYSSKVWLITGMKKGLDITVPVSRIKILFNFYEEIEKKEKIKIITYGHFGDGNIHTSIVYKKGEEKKAEKVKSEICEFVLEIGGTVTGEHGFGLKYIKYTKMFKKNYELMKKIKNILDPDDLFNRGKLDKGFDVEKYDPGDKENLCILCSLCNLHSVNYKKELREDKGTRGEIFLSKLKNHNFLSKENLKSLECCPLGYKGI